MIAEAAAYGADTVLLIVAVLPQHLLKKLIDFSRKLNMEPLVEVHAPIELDVALEAGAKVIGVNNRNLHTFRMDLRTTEHVVEQLTQLNKKFQHDGSTTNEYALCSLSGMSTADDVDRYRQIGVGMCLIGESLMRSSDPQRAITNLCLHPDDYKKEDNSSSNQVGAAYTRGTQLVKVCGITSSEDALVACQAGANLIGIIFVPKSKRCIPNVDCAKEIVETVRNFGERQEAIQYPEEEKSSSPLSSLQSSASKLEDLTQCNRGSLSRPLVVGVFQNQAPEYIRQMVQECGLDLVQLHGKEGMEACNVQNTGAPTIRVVDIDTTASDDSTTTTDTDTLIASLFDTLTSDPVAILLDTSIKGSKDGGGTGVTFDWSLAEKIQNRGLPVLIAGGLKPSNVKDAVESVRPWGVDVSSGVEESPGQKDVDKLRDFVRIAKQTATETSKGF